MNLRPFTLVPLGLALALQAGSASPSSDHKPINRALKQQLPSKLKNSHTAVSSMGFVFNTKEFMPVDEIRPGMRGYALTVFKGTKIEKFHVEILGIISKFNGGKDYILFKALDGPSVTEGLNIAHGMSGSPIYINGRLAGAISMGIPGTDFPRESIALATPIEAMFDSWNPRNPTVIGPISANPAPLDSLNAGGNHFEELPIPVSVSGLSPMGISRMASAFAPYHLELMAGGGDADAGTEKAFAKTATLEPGSAVGVSLVQGDVNITATGTVTYRHGNHLLLFGHPFTGFGPVDAALTTAYVVNIVPSYDSSVKLGSPLRTVGRITQDRPYAVGAEIGPPPAMIPVTVSVNDVTAQVMKTYHVNVINHPLLTSTLVTTVADQLIDQVHGQPGDCISDVIVDADVNGYGHIVRENRYFDDINIGTTSTSDLDNIVRTVTGNEFTPLTLKSVHLSVILRHSHDTANVERIFLTRSKYAPGDTVHVGIVLRPFEQPSVEKFVDIVIPKDTPNGSLNLSVHGGAPPSTGGPSSLLGALLMIRPVDNGSGSNATNVSQLVKRMLEEPQNDQLVTRLELPTSAVVVNGTKLTQLPPTMVGAMLTARTTGQRQERDEVKVTKTLPYVVSGDQILTITVQEKPLAGPAPPADKVVTPAASTTTMSSMYGNDMGSSQDYLTSSSIKSQGTTFPSDNSNQLETPAIVPQVVTVSGPLPAPVVAAIPGAVPHVTPAGPDAPAPDTAKPTTPKSVVRTEVLWRQSGASDFNSGTLENVAVTDKGDVSPAETITAGATTPASYLWSLADDGNGGLYAGGGDNGTVYHITGDKASPLYKSTDLEIGSVAVDTDGSVYAAGIPSGNVYKIGTDGKAISWFKPAEPYVTAITPSASGKIYIGTGGGTASVYAVPTSGIAPLKPLLTTQETQILCLGTDTSGNVYAGTSPNGLVYKITPNGTASVLWDSPEAFVTGVTVDPNGTVYAATGPRGNIYKLNQDGTATALLSHTIGDLTGLTVDNTGKLRACAGNVIYTVRTDGSVTTTTGPDGIHFVSLTAGKNGGVYAGTSTVGAVYSVESGLKNGAASYTSPIYDAGVPSHWGTLTWDATNAPGFKWFLEARTGDTPTPDDSWSPWSGPYATPGVKIEAPLSRFIQYQAIFTDSNYGTPIIASLPIIGQIFAKTAPASLHDVTISYLPVNQGPKVTLAKPVDGSVLSSAQLLSWTVQNPDKDTLSYDLFYSQDNGATWKPITKKATPPPPAGPPAPDASSTAPGAPQPVAKHKLATTAPTDPAASLAAMKTDLDNHPELPAAVREQIMAQAPGVITAETGATPPAATAPTTPVDLTDTSFSWDTTEAHDGPTLIKVIASDRPSNAVNYKTDTDVSQPVLIVNTKPTLTLGPATTAPDGTTTITGKATAALNNPENPILAVQFKVDGGNPLAAAPTNDLFDEPTKSFQVVTAPLKKGPHSIDVQAQDRAGNWTTQTVKVSVN